MDSFKRKQSGFSLLEVLVSVVILAIGLLGIAALQAKTIQYNHSAQLRSIAIEQVSSMIDRMRANYAGVEAGLYNNASGIPKAPNCVSCTNAEIATRDINQWNTENALLLPLGQGTISSNGSNYIITLRWDNDRTGATGTGCSGNTKVDLTCLIMEVRL